MNQRPSNIETCHHTVINPKTDKAQIKINPTKVITFGRGFDAGYIGIHNFFEKVQQNEDAGWLVRRFKFSKKMKCQYLSPLVDTMNNIIIVMLFPSSKLNGRTHNIYNYLSFMYPFHFTQMSYIRSIFLKTLATR